MQTSMSLLLRIGHWVPTSKPCSILPIKQFGGARGLARFRVEGEYL
jgi:hypothetical protein